MPHTDYNSLFMPTYARSGSPMVRGNGMYLFDADGKKYLDFGSGIAVNALGHGHPRLLGRLKEQGENLIHSSNLYFSKPQIDLAALLVAHAGFDCRVFLCNSGTEAIEASIKFARKKASAVSKNKYHVLSFYRGFHGRTYGALSATAQEKFQDGFGPMLTGFHYATLNDEGGTKEILDKHDFAAIIVEPIQGEGGVNITTQAFLSFLRAYADSHDIALIFDEIQCGVGRTGKLWCWQQYGIEPDILALAKPLGGGLPLGAALCKPHIASAISPGNHGTTFGGNPLACALGCELLSMVSEPAFLAHVAKMGNHLSNRLKILAKTNPAILDVRGMGMLIGVQLSSDPAAIVQTCREKGLLLIKAEHDTIRFLPPLVVEEPEIDLAVSIFAEVLASWKK